MKEGVIDVLMYIFSSYADQDENLPEDRDGIDADLCAAGFDPIEIDKAFEWLEISFERRHSNLTNSLFNPWLEPLYDDPRWEVFLDKMGLQKYWKKKQSRR